MRGRRTKTGEQTAKTTTRRKRDTHSDMMMMLLLLLLLLLLSSGTITRPYVLVRDDDDVPHSTRCFFVWIGDLEYFLSNTFERGETFGTTRKALKRPQKRHKKDHAHKKKRESSLDHLSKEQKRKKEKKNARNERSDKKEKKKHIIIIIIIIRGCLLYTSPSPRD